MSQVGLTETAKGDSRKFELWLQGRQEVYIIQAATLEQKLSWVKRSRGYCWNNCRSCGERRFDSIALFLRELYSFLQLQGLIRK